MVLTCVIGRMGPAVLLTVLFMLPPLVLVVVIFSWGLIRATCKSAFVLFNRLIVHVLMPLEAIIGFKAKLPVTALYRALEWTCLSMLGGSQTDVIISMEGFHVQLTV
jgi:hypothetical protein